MGKGSAIGDVMRSARRMAAFVEGVERSQRAYVEAERFTDAIIARVQERFQRVVRELGSDPGRKEWDEWEMGDLGDLVAALRVAQKYGMTLTIAPKRLGRKRGPKELTSDELREIFDDFKSSGLSPVLYAQLRNQSPWQVRKAREMFEAE